MKITNPRSRQAVAGVLVAALATLDVPAHANPASLCVQPSVAEQVRERDENAALRAFESTRTVMGKLAPACTPAARDG